MRLAGIKLFRWAWRVTFTLILFVTLAVCALLFTEAGRTWAVYTVVNQINSGKLHIQLEQVKAPELGHWTIQQLKIVLQENQLVLARNIELKFTPAALLKGQVLIQSLYAQSADIEIIKNAASPEQETPKELSLALPDSPIRITVKALHIESISLAGINKADKNLPSKWQLEASGDLFAPFTPPTLNVDVTTLTAPKTRIHLHSKILNYHELQLNGELTEDADGFIATQLPFPTEPIDITFNVHVQPQENNRWKAEFDAASTLFQNKPIALKGEVQGHSNDHIQASLIASIAEQQQYFALNFRPEKLTVSSKLHNFPLDLASPWVPKLKRGHISGTVKAEWDEFAHNKWPHAHAELSSSLTYAEQSLTAQWSGKIQDKTLFADILTVDADKTHISAAGDLALNTLDSHIDLELTDFSTELLRRLQIPLPDYLHTLQADSERATIRVTNTLLDPSIELDTEINGAYQNQKFNLVFSGNGNKNAVTAQNFQLDTINGFLAATGTLDWTSDATDLQITLKELNEKLLIFVPNHIDLTALKDASFTVSGQGNIKGKLTSPSIKTDLSASGTLVINDQHLPFEIHSKGAVQFGKLNQLRIQLDRASLNLDRQNVLFASGSYTEENLDLQLDITQLPTQALKLFGVHAATGQAQASFKLSGNFLHPHIEGYANYQDFFYSSGDKPKKIPVEVQLDVSTNNELFILESTYLASGSKIANLNISSPLHIYFSEEQNSIPLKMSAQGEIDLAFTRWFLDADLHQLKGKVALDLSSSGTLSNPEIVGTISVLNTEYAHTPSGTQWDNIEATLTADGSRLTIQNMSAVSGESGSVKLAGKIDWHKDLRSSSSAIDLSVQAQDTIVLQRRDLSGNATGLVEIKGSFDDIWVTGNIDVAPLSASIDSALQSSIPTIEVSDITDESDTEKKQLLPTIHLDIGIEAKQQAYIRGRGLQAELEGKIKLEGTTIDPKYNGVFRTRRGRMDLFGRRFHLQEGEVRFSNDVVGLLIPAEYSSKDVTINAEIYGTANEPKIRLTSTPSMPEDEIVAWLIFGKSVRDITPFQAIQLASTISTLRNGSTFDPVDSARNLLGVDSLEIDSSDSDSGTDINVGVGKYINEKVYMEFKKSSDPVQPWEAKVEIELTPRFRLESGATEHGEGGAMLLWTKDY